MSYSRNNNLVASYDEDLDPTNDGLVIIQAPEGEPQKLSAVSKSVGFNTFKLTLFGNQPQKLIGADPARLRMLLNIENTTPSSNVFIGDQSSITNLFGFNLTNHNAGGSIEINTTDEIWIVYKDATITNKVETYVWIERATNI